MNDETNEGDRVRCRARRFVGLAGTAFLFLAFLVPWTELKIGVDSPPWEPTALDLHDLIEMLAGDLEYRGVKLVQPAPPYKSHAHHMAHLAAVQKLRWRISNITALILLGLLSAAFIQFCWLHPDSDSWSLVGHYSGAAGVALTATLCLLLAYNSNLTSYGHQLPVRSGFWCCVIGSFLVFLVGLLSLGPHNRRFGLSFQLGGGLLWTLLFAWLLFG